MTHPLTDEIIEEIAQFEPDLTDPFILNRIHDMQTAADWQLEKVIKWLNFDYQTDPNLSRETKQRGGFKAIAIALEKAMRPQDDNS